MILTLAAILVFLFRRSLFGWLIGTRGLCLLDATIFIVMAAWMFGIPGPWPVFNYIVGVVYILVAMESSWAFVRLGENTNVDQHDAE